MKRLLIATIITMLYNVPTYATGPKIIETENGYIVEYNGTPDPNKEKMQIAVLKERISVLSSEISIKKRAASTVKDPDRLYTLLIEGINKTRELIRAENELAEITIKDNDRLKSYIQEQQLKLNKLDLIENEANTANYDYNSENSSSIKKQISEVGISSINVMQIRTTSIGDAEISIKADVCNNGKAGKTYVTLGGYDFSGHELTSHMFSGTYLNQSECRTVSDTTYIDVGKYLNIREWKVKETSKY